MFQLRECVLRSVPDHTGWRLLLVQVTTRVWIRGRDSFNASVCVLPLCSDVQLCVDLTQREVHIIWLVFMHQQVRFFYNNDVLYNLKICRVFEVHWSVTISCWKKIWMQSHAGFLDAVDIAQMIYYANWDCSYIAGWFSHINRLNNKIFLHWQYKISLEIDRLFLTD